MKMANIDHCFDNMFTNPKDSQGVSERNTDMSCNTLQLTQQPQPCPDVRWFKSVLCRNLWQKTAKASFCTSVTCVRDREAFQSTFCGGGAGTLRALVWRWKDPVTSNWKISMQHQVNCLSLIMVCIGAPQSHQKQELSWAFVDSGRVWPLWFTGEGGVDGDGDITRPENITAFRNFVLENTDKRGLHCLMADGVRLSDKAHFCNRFQFIEVKTTASCSKSFFSNLLLTVDHWSRSGLLCGRSRKYPGGPEQTAVALSVPHSALHCQERCVDAVSPSLRFCSTDGNICGCCQHSGWLTFFYYRWSLCL